MLVEYYVKNCFCNIRKKGSRSNLIQHGEFGSFTLMNLSKYSGSEIKLPDSMKLVYGDTERKLG